MVNEIRPVPQDELLEIGDGLCGAVQIVHTQFRRTERSGVGSEQRYPIEANKQTYPGRYIIRMARRILMQFASYESLNVEIQARLAQ